MNRAPFQSSAPPPPPLWQPMVPPNPLMTSRFWESRNFFDQLGNLQDTLKLAEALQKELELLKRGEDVRESKVKVEDDSAASASDGFSKLLEDKGIRIEEQQATSMLAANDVISKLRAQLEPFRVITDAKSPWEEKSAAFRLFDRIQKSKRNKRWRKSKRQQLAEFLAKDHERFEQADKEADEWRAREIAKDIARCKVEKMKEIAKIKAQEERRRLESELEMLLVVEKLQELRSMRIEKLKRQGHFLPEEDDKFLEKVRAAVEEEEHQANVAADADIAKDTIAAVEESRNSVQSSGTDLKNISVKGGDHVSEAENSEGSSILSNKEASDQLDKRGRDAAYDSVSNLPIEFYHYYYGSNHDMGTLIEVRRTWDAYIRPGGSRIPGHWVQPPPPADEVWASYLVKQN